MDAIGLYLASFGHHFHIFHNQLDHLVADNVDVTRLQLGLTEVTVRQLSPDHVIFVVVQGLFGGRTSVGFVKFFYFGDYRLESLDIL